MTDLIRDGDVPKVIIDTDPGIDDAMALLLAFSAHKRGEIIIIGITITHGNHNDQDLLAKYDYEGLAWAVIVVFTRFVTFVVL